jgi:hypothetical protein
MFGGQVSEEKVSNLTVAGVSQTEGHSLLVVGHHCHYGRNLPPADADFKHFWPGRSRTYPVVYAQAKVPPMICLGHNATTAGLPEVFEAMRSYFCKE